MVLEKQLKLKINSFIKVIQADINSIETKFRHLLV